MLYCIGKGSEPIEKPQKDQKHNRYRARCRNACNMLMDIGRRGNASNARRFLSAFLSRCKTRNLTGFRISVDGCARNTRFFGLRRRNWLDFGTYWRLSSRLPCRRCASYPCRAVASAHILAPFYKNSLNCHRSSVMLSLRRLQYVCPLSAKRLKRFVYGSFPCVYSELRNFRCDKDNLRALSCKIPKKSQANLTLISPLLRSIASPESSITSNSPLSSIAFAFAW